MRQIFGEWRPDQPSHLHDGLITADGVYPIANGYAPLPQFAAAVNGELAGPCIGAGAYRAGGSVHVFAVTASNIYSYSTAGFTSLKSGLSGAAAVGARFVNYNELMLITNGVDPVQKFSPASPSATSDLDASCPTLRFMAVVRGFVVGGYADEDPLAVAWSDNGDPATWTPGSGEAGLAILPTGGDITGVVGGEYGLIFQESRIVRQSYTQDDAIWQFDEISTDIGCIAPWSLASYGRLTFFLSSKGFMACDGIMVEAIGSEKVDRTFLALFDRTYIDNMSAVVDPVRGLYIVSVPSSKPTSRIFIYSFGEQKWSSASVTAERLFASLSASIDLDGLDAIYGNLDAVPTSLDSVLFRGGYPALMLFDGLHRLGALTGPNMPASLVDTRKELIVGLKARIRSVRPLTDASSPTVSIYGSNSLSEAPTETAYTARSAGGFYRMRQSYNLSSLKLAIPAGATWSYVQGYDIEAAQGTRP